MRSAAITLGDEWAWRSQGELLHSVKTGETAFNHAFGMGIFDYFDKNSDVAEMFNDTMTNLTYQDLDAVLAAYDFSGIETIVDVGGGHGILIAAILKEHPQMQGILADLSPVLEGAEKQLISEGVEKRCQRIETDFFKAVPGGGDAYILRQIIHDWNDEQSIAILKNCHQQMNKSHRLLLVEKVIPPGNDPNAGKILDIQMMLYTGGLERTADEYVFLMNEAGFKLTEIVPTHGLSSVIEGRPV